MASLIRVKRCPAITLPAFSTSSTASSQAFTDRHLRQELPGPRTKFVHRLRQQVGGFARSAHAMIERTDISKRPGQLPPGFLGVTLAQDLLHRLGGIVAVVILVVLLLTGSWRL